MPELAEVVTEIERALAGHGWDQPPRLYALVNTGELLAGEPQLAGLLGESDPAGITPVEQEAFDDDVEDLLPRIEWPPSVLGCALVNEVVMLPDGVAVERDEDAFAHPEHRDVRLVVGVLRDGERAATIRIRGRDGEEDQVLSAPDLVPNLATALHATLVGG
jgi:hypothetical protein